MIKSGEKTTSQDKAQSRHDMDRTREAGNAITDYAFTLRAFTLRTTFFAFQPLLHIISLKSSL